MTYPKYSSPCFCCFWKLDPLKSRPDKASATVEVPKQDWVQLVPPRHPPHQEVPPRPGWGFKLPQRHLFVLVDLQRVILRQVLSLAYVAMLPPGLASKKSWKNRKLLTHHYLRHVKTIQEIQNATFLHQNVIPWKSDHSATREQVDRETAEPAPASSWVPMVGKSWETCPGIPGTDSKASKVHGKIMDRRSPKGTRSPSMPSSVHLGQIDLAESCMPPLKNRHKKAQACFQSWK
jgi:hypothetical protein